MRSCVRCKCMYEKRDMLGALCPFCSQQLRPTPAQEEKVEMVCCKSCGARIAMGIYCEPCERQLPNENLPSTPIEAEEAARECREYNLRQLHREAALAALTIAARPSSAQQGPVYPKDAVSFAIDVADEFIRQYNPDAVIAEVVG